MRIFGWTADDGPCAHYRVAMPFEQLKSLGHDVAYGQKIPPEWQDVPMVVGQRVCMPGATSTWVKWANRGKKLIFEIDDDLFDVHHTNAAAWQFFSQPFVRRNLILSIKVATAVTVTTPDLAEVVSQWNDNIHILPNCIDQKLLDLPRDYERTPRLGWQGSQTHEMDFAEISKPLGRLLRRYPDLRFLFIGHAHGRSLPKDKLDFLPWTEDLDEHYQQTSQIDIGVAPLRPHPFNRAKSDIRVKEYAALGMPYVASAMPAYITFTQGNGFIAETDHVWYNKMRDLVNDLELRRELGLRGRELAAGWTIQRRVDDWENVYRKVLGEDR